MVIGALTHKHLQVGVLGFKVMEPFPYLLLAHCRRQGIRAFFQEFRGDIGIKVSEAFGPNLIQHCPHVRVCVRKVRK